MNEETKDTAQNHEEVTGDIESMSFNTAISALMVLTNHLLTLKEGSLEAAQSLL
jgi:leucyl-tRNA synthetase